MDQRNSITKLKRRRRSRHIIQASTSSLNFPLCLLLFLYLTLFVPFLVGGVTEKRDFIVERGIETETEVEVEEQQQQQQQQQHQDENEDEDDLLIKEIDLSESGVSEDDREIILPTNTEENWSQAATATNTDTMSKTKETKKRILKDYDDSGDNIDGGYYDYYKKEEENGKEVSREKDGNDDDGDIFIPIMDGKGDSEESIPALEKSDTNSTNIVPSTKRNKEKLIIQDESKNKTERKDEAVMKPLVVTDNNKTKVTGSINPPLSLKVMKTEGTNQKKEKEIEQLISTSKTTTNNIQSDEGDDDVDNDDDDNDDANKRHGVTGTLSGKRLDEPNSKEMQMEDGFNRIVSKEKKNEKVIEDIDNNNNNNNNDVVTKDMGETHGNGNTSNSSRIIISKEMDNSNSKMDMKDDTMKLVQNNDDEEKDEQFTAAASTSSSSLPSSKTIEGEEIPKKKMLKDVINNDNNKISEEVADYSNAESSSLKNNMEGNKDVEDAKIDDKELNDKMKHNTSSLEVKSDNRELNEDRRNTSLCGKSTTTTDIYSDYEYDSFIDLDFNVKEENETDQSQEYSFDNNPDTGSVDSCNKSKITESGENSCNEVNVRTQNLAQDLQDSIINVTDTNIKLHKRKIPPKEMLDNISDKTRTVLDAGTESVVEHAQYTDSEEEDGEEQQQEHDMESSTIDTVTVYHGEPWGQYRSARRLPDIELLRLIFEGTNDDGSTNKNKGDIISQKVLDEWERDPLYDKSMMIDAAQSLKIDVEKTTSFEEQDQRIHEYRSKFVDEDNHDVADPPTKQTGDKGIKHNNNSEFVEGLDDIDDFFEGVDPPDELDVGFGSSIQDVLLDKGKHILTKKIREALQLIHFGCMKIGGSLKYRIEQFQHPFQKSQKTKKNSSSMNGDTMESSLHASKTKHQDGRSVRDTIIATWNMGKQSLEHLSNWVDKLIDRFEGESEEHSDDVPMNFEDFKGFDLDNLSSLMPTTNDS